MRRNEAQQYLAWLSSRTGKKYRLATEVERECAACGNSRTRHSWGNEAGVGRQLLRRPSDSEHPRGHAGASFKPNPFGLNHMLGGVAQWVQEVRYVTNRFRLARDLE